MPELRLFYDFLLSGENDGFEWQIAGHMTASGTYYALVKVGSTVKITRDCETVEGARDAGRQLLVDTLAELVDVYHG